MIDAGNAIFSGYTAATDLGVTSANIKMIRVNTKGSTATVAHSPNTRVVMAPATIVAKILTKLLPINITLIRRSGRFSRFDARVAPLCFFFARCRSR